MEGLSEGSGQGDEIEVSDTPGTACQGGGDAAADARQGGAPPAALPAAAQPKGDPSDAAARLQQHLGDLRAAWEAPRCG
jgi:hypothetical protein